MKHTRLLLALAVLSVASACGDDGPNDPSNLSGSMAFSFTGAGGGTFNVSGAAPALSANIGSTNWAAGTRDDGANQVGVIGVRTRSGNRYDMMILGISRVTVGSASVQSDCDPDLGENCSGFVFFTNVADTDEDFDFLCVATTGTMAISSITDERAQGTFTGGGTCVNGTTGATSSFAVTGGSFDIRLLSESQFPQ